MSDEKATRLTTPSFNNDADSQTATVAAEAENATPSNVNEDKGPGAKWKNEEVQEIPYKWVVDDL